MDSTSSTKSSVELAHVLARASEAEWPNDFERLRREERLSLAVRQLNLLLDDEEHRRMAIETLKKIGLWRSL